MAIMRKKSINVLRHLKKIATDLEEIARLEAGDIEYNNLKIDLLKADNEAHKAEVDLATKVAKNINDLIGGV